MATPVKNFLDSSTPTQAIINFSAEIASVKGCLTKTGVKLLGSHNLDDVAERVLIVSRQLGTGALRNELEIRTAGQKVVARLADIYRAIDQKIESMSIAEHGCQECLSIAASQGAIIGPQEGVPFDFKTCDRCREFIRNIQESNRLGFGAQFKNVENNLF